MRIIYLYGCLFLLSVSLFSCQTKEDKAADLIKKELSKTLYDFDSYSPIETIVTEAKLSVYTDTACWSKARTVLAAFICTEEFLKKVKEEKERMDIWGIPDAYSSSYSDSQYKKHFKKMKDAMECSLISLQLYFASAESLKDTLATLDNKQIVGWEVIHRFRCKTRGGSSTIGEYRYVIDPDFKEVLIEEDKDDEEYEAIRKMINAVTKDEYQDLIDADKIFDI